ncbi:MAG: alanine racemase [Bacillota bacterium]
MEQKIKRPAWLEIKLQALANNYQFIRSKLDQKTKIAAVVKADAYGHGAVKIAQKLVDLGTEYLCVGSPDEGIELRNEGLEVPILVLAEVLESQYDSILQGDLIQTVASCETLFALNNFAAQNNKKIKIHLKCDTGMGRIGFLPEELSEIYNLALSLENLKVEGIFSHLARADETDKDFSNKQLASFNFALNKIKASNHKLPLIHLANSAAVIDLKSTYLDLVRPGIMLYGLLPSLELKKEAFLEPILEFKTKIVQLRELPPASTISYGSTYTTKEQEKLAVLPIGYKDGYPRLLSNQGEVLIRGQRAPIRGKICMGQTIVSVAEIENVEIGDEVVLIGKQGEAEITAAEIAELASTISYEIVCNLDRNLKRIYLEDH